MMRILLLDAETRKAPPVVRALAQAGAVVTCASSRRLAAGGWSRFCRRRMRAPSSESAQFPEWVAQVAEREAIDVVLASEETTILPLLDARTRIERFARLPFPDGVTFRTAADKAAALKASAAAAIPVPRTCIPSSVEEALEMIPTIGFPCVAKPRFGSGGRGTVLLRGLEESRRYLESRRTCPLPIVQEFIPHGGAFGVSVLYDFGGRLVACFTHRRLREYPPSGGASTLCESVARPDLERLACRVLEHIKWVGLAMVEFRIDARDNTPRFLEINPRFWGSIALPIAAGINFPALLCRAALGEQLPRVPAAPPGVRARWLVPGDILHFLANRGRFRLKPSFFRFFDRSVHGMVDSWRDPLPSFVLLLRDSVELFQARRHRDLARGW